MTTNTQERAVPELTLAWRLKMALAFGDVSRETMAEELGVSPSSISRWCNDDKGEKEPPKRAYIAQWALLTGVDREWLASGEEFTAPDPDPGPGTDHAAALRQLADRKREGRHGSSATCGYPISVLAA